MKSPGKPDKPAIVDRDKHNGLIYGIIAALLIAAIAICVGAVHNSVATHDQAVTICSKGSDNTVKTSVGTFTITDITVTSYAPDPESSIPYRETRETMSGKDMHESLIVGQVYTFTLVDTWPFGTTKIVDIGYAASAPPCRPS